MSVQIEKVDIVKAKALIDYLNKLYPGKFGELDIVLGYGQTRYRYKFNEATEMVEQPKIIIGHVSNKDFNEFVVNYYNKTFNMNLKCTPEVRIIQEICHECGHHYNIEYYKYRDDEYAEQLNDLDKYDLKGEERRIAYRQIDEEHDADRFAAEVMKEHLEELIKIIK